MSRLTWKTAFALSWRPSWPPVWVAAAAAWSGRRPGGAPVPPRAPAPASRRRRRRRRQWPRAPATPPPPAPPPSTRSAAPDRWPRPAAALGPWPLNTGHTKTRFSIAFPFDGHRIADRNSQPVGSSLHVLLVEFTRRQVELANFKVVQYEFWLTFFGKNPRKLSKTHKNP